MAHTLNGISIPSGLVWVDEFDWLESATETEHGITGALLVDAGERLAGRPITLEADTDAGWIERSVLAAIKALADAPGVSYTFTHHDGRSFTVLVLEIAARSVARPELPPANWPYVATIKMIEV